MRRPLLRLGIAACATLLSLELLLQLLALGASWIRTDESAAAGRPVVLCVGDSLTWGLGAGRDEAWPARVSTALRPEFPELQMVNDARPGQTSRDVLERLGPRLGILQPDVVCILCGWNDTWSRPLPLEALPRDASTFRWRWRTWRLLQLALAGGPDATESDVPDQAQDDGEGPPAFIGTWHVLGREFSFAADGTARFEGIAATWERTADGVRMRYEGAAEGGFGIRLRVRHDDRLEILVDGWREHLLAHPGPAADATASELAQDLVEADMDEPAADGLRDVLRRNPDDLAATSSLVRLGLCVDPEALRARTRRLQRAWKRSQDDAQVGHAVAIGLRELGQHDEAREVIHEVTDRHPAAIDAWQTRIDLSRGDPDARLALRTELDTVTAALADDDTARAELALLLARSADDPGLAIAHLRYASLSGVQVPELTECVRALVRGGLARTALREAAESVDRSDATAAFRVRTAVRRGTADDDEVYAVLEHHLEMAVEACEEAGAKVVLLGYPFANERHQAAVEAVAARHELPVVENRSRFDELLAESPREDWFVDPIHCTARGYAEMAARAEPLVRAALR